MSCKQWGLTSTDVDDLGRGRRKRPNRVLSSRAPSSPKGGSKAAAGNCPSPFFFCRVVREHA